MKRILCSFFLLATSLVTYAQISPDISVQTTIDEVNRKFINDQNNNNSISYVGKKAAKSTDVMFYKFSLTEDTKCVSENFIMWFYTSAILFYDDVSQMGLGSKDMYVGIGSRIMDFVLNTALTNIKDVPVYIDLSESYFTKNGDTKPIVDKSIYGSDDFYKSKYLIKLSPKESKLLDYMRLGVLGNRSSYGGPNNTVYLSVGGPVLSLGEQKKYSYEESPYKYTVTICYSTNPDYSNKSMLKASFYVSEVFGGPWDKMMNGVKVKDLKIEGNPFYFFGRNPK